MQIEDVSSTVHLKTRLRLLADLANGLHTDAHYVEYLIRKP